MKTFLMVVLAAAVFAPAAWCQEEDLIGQIERTEQQMELRRLQMQMEREEADMAFQQQMRELELEQRRVEIEYRRHQLREGRGDKDKAVPLVLLIIVVNVLAAVWVYQDIRRRNAGSGIWVALALLAGLFGALVYAVVRIGEAPGQK